MPNMDDIAFFESSPYRHRGGIWSDASRFEKTRPHSPMPASDDSQSTASAPPVIVSEPFSPSRPLAASQVSDMPDNDSDDFRPASVLPIIQDQATSVKEPDPCEHIHCHYHRPFLMLLPAILTDRSQSEPLAVDEERGRSPSIYPVARSSSDIPPEIYEPVDSSMDAPVLEFPSSHSRRPSVHSVRSHGSGKSTDSPEPSTTPRKSSDASRDHPTSPSPSSFLSTLKSKAGDKQALSNTARETMRKWGVNWSNLKKKEFSSEETGDPASKLRSKVEIVGNKRASYAEVRAAVAERRDRGLNAQTEEDGGSSRSTSPASLAEALNSKDIARGGHEPPLGVPSLSHQTGRGPTTPALASNKSLPSVSRVNTDIDAISDTSEDEVRPIPIRAQPQAKTMTIPGIHASHRGEVMSMGYVAPQPSLLSEAVKSKNPTIQSVYRLWRNPINTGQESDVPALIEQTEPSPSTEVHSTQLPLLQGPGPVQHPPPLPPRPVPGTLLHSSRRNQSGLPSTEPMEMEGDAVLSGEPVASLSDEMTPSATTISTTTTSAINTPPPLPPRRISSTA